VLNGCQGMVGLMIREDHVHQFIPDRPETIGQLIREDHVHQVIPNAKASDHRSNDQLCDHGFPGGHQPRHPTIVACTRAAWDNGLLVQRRPTSTGWRC